MIEIPKRAALSVTAATLLLMAAGCTTAETRATALTTNTSPVAYSMPPPAAPPGAGAGGAMIGGMARSGPGGVSGVMPIAAMGQPIMAQPGLAGQGVAMGPVMAPILYAPVVTQIGSTMAPPVNAMLPQTPALGYGGAMPVGYNAGASPIGYNAGAMPIAASQAGVSGPVMAPAATALPMMLPVPTYTAPVYARPNG